jgi:hypothetical protein
MYAATVTAKPRFTEISAHRRILPAKSKRGHIPPFKLDQDTARFKEHAQSEFGGRS